MLVDHCKPISAISEEWGPSMCSLKNVANGSHLVQIQVNAWIATSRIKIDLKNSHRRHTGNKIKASIFY